jgi:spermidine synthase
MLGTYQLLLTIILMSLGYVILSYYTVRKKIKILVKLIIAAAAAVVILSGPDLFFRQLLLPGINVTGTKDTPYGNITYGEYSGERSLYYNHRLLAYADDAAEREENVHYGLLQRPNPEKVLLISGSLKSNLPEILKYPVKTIFYIERDPGLASAVSSEAIPSGVDLVAGKRDAFRYLKTSEGKFNAILLLLPPPSTLSLNRYYTTEFFYSVRKNLNADGVFVCSPGIWDNYPNRESLRLFSSIYNSLKEVFESVEPVAGNKLYFIASNSEVSISICSLIEERKISNTYVGPDFLADDLIEARSSEIVYLLDPEAKKNSSLFPVATFHFQTYSFSRDISEKLPSLVFLFIVFALPMVTIRRKNLLMYCSASALAGFEIIILLILQLTAGNMYQFTGIILAVLMAGLAAGAGTDIRFLNSISLRAKALSMAFYLAVIALAASFILSLNSIQAIILILISALPPSFITGHIFRELTIADKNGSESSATYSADLAGSAFGFMLISGIAIPLIGLKASLFLLSGLIFAGILFGTERNKY